jgi:hypothetical protein
MAATATARTSAGARRAPARRAPARRRARNGHTPITGFVPVAAAAGAVGGLADSWIFVRLTRGRLWIALLGALLVGIVGLNVIALSFSASSSEAGQAADALRRQNSAFRAQIAAKLSNSEIQAVAADLGLVMPGPGAFAYVDASPDDAARAAQRLRDGELTAGVAAVAPVETATLTEVPVDPATTTDPVDPAAATTTTVPPAEATAPAAEASVPSPETTAPPADTTAAAAGAIGAP